MKKSLLSILALTMMMGLVACGQPEEAIEAEPVAAPMAPAAASKPQVEKKEPVAPKQEVAKETTGEEIDEFAKQAWAIEVPKVDDLIAKPGAAPAPVAKPAPKHPPILDVREFFVGTAVENRIPKGIAADFQTDVGRLYAFAKIENRDRPTHVVMVWSKNGKVQNRVKLNVGKSDGWRTWSTKTIRPGDEGAWDVEVLDEAGRIIETTGFNVSPRRMAMLGH